jgi:hypothetical protein
VTALAVLAVLGILVRIADSVGTQTVTTRSRCRAASDGHRVPSALRAPVPTRGAR